MHSTEPVNLGWVYRPDHSGGDLARAPEHAGKRVHAVGKAVVDDSGRVEVVLADGERVRAYRHEVVPG
ncbi:hypothetical protein GCM10027290_60810 [Micromonospora sonneratiae]|uniref:Uncharacterized protein n=1 Tax=Micromonospora sonneratiae TaxID=1184706 RepID=A0ABW3YJI0_9ACTN